MDPSFFVMLAVTTSRLFNIEICGIHLVIICACKLLSNPNDIEIIFTLLSLYSLCF